jgi:hypothetical protein
MIELDPIAEVGVETLTRAQPVDNSDRLAATAGPGQSLTLCRLLKLSPMKGCGDQSGLLGVVASEIEGSRT